MRSFKCLRKRDSMDELKRFLMTLGIGVVVWIQFMLCLTLRQIYNFNP